MNRRAFLTTLSAALAGATLDPERLLWRPGAKTIFLPSPADMWSQNTLITPVWVTRDVALYWQNAINLIGLTKPLSDEAALIYLSNEQPQTIGLAQVGDT